jgi:hypothetical protein
LFVMLACALTAGVLFSNLSDRSAALVVARPVTTGKVIGAGDLREALVSSNTDGATVPASQLSSVVGRIAAVDLVPGAFLAPGQLATGPTVATGQAVVGATLKEGQFPVDLAVGNRVLAVTLPPDALAGMGTSITPAPVAASVVGMRPLDSGGGVVVSLAVAPDKASSLAVVGARSLLTLVLAPR